MAMPQNQPPWAGRIPQHKIERLYDSDARGILDEELIDDIGYSLLARCESILAFTSSHRRDPICPGCLQNMMRDGDTISCERCQWSCNEEEFLKANRKKHLHAGRLEPFLEEYRDQFPRARDAKARMLLIDILIHRCHGEHEGTADSLRAGAINLIGGKPGQVMEFLDRLGGIRRSQLDEEAGHADWVASVRSKRRGGWR